MTGAPLQFPLRIPLVEKLGLKPWAFGDGQAELRVDLADTHLNSVAVARATATFKFRHALPTTVRQQKALQRAGKST